MAGMWRPSIACTRLGDTPWGARPTNQALPVVVHHVVTPRIPLEGPARATTPRTPSGHGTQSRLPPDRARPRCWRRASWHARMRAPPQQQATASNSKQQQATAGNGTVGLTDSVPNISRDSTGCDAMLSRALSGCRGRYPLTPEPCTPGATSGGAPGRRSGAAVGSRARDPGAGSTVTVTSLGPSADGRSLRVAPHAIVSVM